MINSDAGWQSFVTLIAQGQVHDHRAAVDEAEEYMRSGDNWYRLRETDHGKYVRELAASVPDPVLKRHYRDKVLALST